ncbi:MAG: hypothetical protein KKC29_00700 [Alphaproteobacteria bacterium]|jgi:hypothetical protein|nr:hypothetical protein [Alphaproteobacteria bacterium]MBU2041205.1 hypothetical protein [Alphaproteobacteria bacterium]MBU2125832.1 hypothetical protein [Alphaproteobacteria bacterium]MBU2208115.1 hypothetical protein [Alphaproteobacteria bacterium]MBU2289605.1 hypothetical protein [Alphaproteobacteria bacterium]
MNALVDTPRPSLLRKAAVIVLLAGLGGAFGYGAATLTDGVLTRWEDELAVVMSAAMLGIGLITAFIVARRPADVPRGCGVLQVVVMLLAAAMFLLPVFGPVWATPEVVFGAVLLLVAVQSGANLMLWRTADEMLRRVMLETSALAFWAVQLGLFIYAAAERLGLVGTITGWGLIGILMGVYFIASIVAAARRGLH